MVAMSQGQPTSRHRPHPALHRQAVQLLRRDGHGARSGRDRGAGGGGPRRGWPRIRTISTQRRLNFEMSAKNLFQSFARPGPRAKIQGLLNECMTFLDDELSVITGPYDNLLSINEVIDSS